MDENPIVPVAQEVEEPKTTQEPIVGELTVSAPQAGIPYEQYHKKLDRIKELEDELNQFKSPVLSDNEVYSDEGKALKGEINTLKTDLSDVKGLLAKEKLISSNPIFKEKWQEFEEFRNEPDNKGMNLNTAGKAFLVENGLFEPQRKGVEKPTGGSKVVPTSGMTADDVKTLRLTNFKKYQELLMKGMIKID